MSLEVRLLQRTDDRSSFSSGNADLDRFFHRYAGQNQFRHHLGTTWVAVAGEQRIVGYATVSPGEVRASALPAKRRARFPAYPLPVLRLTRVAVAQDAQRLGVGAALLRATFVAAHRLASEYGCIGVLVDAKPDAVAFYTRYGFDPITLTAGELGDRPLPTTMFLELGAIPF